MELEPADIYPAVRRFLEETGLQRTLKAFLKETGIEDRSVETTDGLVKRLRKLDLVGACKVWLGARVSQKLQSLNLCTNSDEVLLVPVASERGVELGLESTEQLSVSKRKRKDAGSVADDEESGKHHLRSVAEPADLGPEQVGQPLDSDRRPKMPKIQQKLEVKAPCREGSAEEAREAKEHKKSRGGKVPRDHRQVFVGGLPFGTTEDILQKDFSECGNIVKLNMPSKGIAFITFDTDDGVVAALKFNGTKYGDRTLKVNTAGAFSPETAVRPVMYKVKVKGFPDSTTDEILKKDFSECGDIERSIIPRDEKGNLAGVAYFTYKDREACDKALAFNWTQYGGSQLMVRLVDDEGGGQKGKGKADVAEPSKGKGRIGKRKDKSTGKGKSGKSAGKGKRKVDKNLNDGPDS